MTQPQVRATARSRSLRLLAHLIVLGALALVPACAGDRPDAEAGGTAGAMTGSGQDGGAGASAGPRDPGPTRGPAGLAAPTPDSTGAIPILARLSEYRIQLFPAELNESRVALTLRNEGERVHTIEIRGDNGMRWRTLPIRPGSAVILSIFIEPGRYTVRSTEPPYVDRGMSALLLVR